MRTKKRGSPSKRVHPLRQGVGVTNRLCSKRLERLATDFGIETSFGGAASRLLEHHGVELSASRIRKITEKHAACAQNAAKKLPKDYCSADEVIVEMDGEMVPTVEYQEGVADRRKAKKLQWEELRIGTTQRPGETRWKYACSFESPQELGDRLAEVMDKVGFSDKSYVHSVGDGALWICEQGERIAGSRFHHLIDMPHLSEYLSAAMTGWVDPREKLSEYGELLLKGKLSIVFGELQEAYKARPSHEGLKACIRYIRNRPGQFDYQGARSRGLPIGSGKVEGTHRSVIQKRLKLSGAWWLKENAAKMAELRVLRANEGWHLLWADSYEPPLQKAA